jgi:hypothetical protein
LKTEPLFKTEAEMCAAFIVWAKEQGYTPYPETAGWDILLVNANGFQTGVEAKLKLNAQVIEQALDRYGLDQGPDYRAVLIPTLRGDILREVCHHIGLDIFYSDGPRSWPSDGRYSFRIDDQLSGRERLDWNPVKRCALPAYLPDVEAGRPAPIQLTPWKVGALKVLAHIEVHGSITRKQVGYYGIDSRRWCGHGAWLAPKSGDPARGGRWVMGKKCPRFDQQHPSVYAQIVAETVAAGPPIDQEAMAI